MSKNSLDILMQDIEVPDVVQKKAQDAFAQIQLEKKGNQVKVMGNQNKKRTSHIWQKKAAAVITAVLVGGCSITALAAVYMHWSHGMQTKMNVSEEQMLELENAENTPVSFPDAADTQGNITVSAAQCLLDGNDIRLAFYIEGYELENHIEPELENLSILLDGKPANNYEWEFYSGIDFDEEGNPVMADGSAVQEDGEGGIIPNYRTAEGKMELDLKMSPVDENGKAITDLEGKTITVQMENFGENAGTWTMEWTLESTSATVDAKLNEVLGNSGATVTNAKVSPMSVEVTYDFPRKEIKEILIDENGNEAESTDYAEPPTFAGIKMVDGTVYMGIGDGGISGYEDAESSKYVKRVSFSKIVNPQEVESLLFLREDATIQGEGEITEADCYVVNIP